MLYYVLGLVLAPLATVIGYISLAVILIFVYNFVENKRNDNNS